MYTSVKFERKKKVEIWYKKFYDIDESTEILFSFFFYYGIIEVLYLNGCFVRFFPLISTLSFILNLHVTLVFDFLYMNFKNKNLFMEFLGFFFVLPK